MTDEQIIESLKRCFTRGFDESNCYECPFYTATAKCTEDLNVSVIDLISRQKAENDRLLQKIQQLKSEAIREFAERLKKYFSKHSGAYWTFKGEPKYIPEDIILDIDSIAKEMEETTC